MKERELVRLKEANLNLTDAQADSIVAINMEVMQQMRGLRDMTDDEQKAKRKELNEYRLARWTAALKDKDLAVKVAEYYEMQRAQRQQAGDRPQQ
jgi:hypothetical protein